MDFILQVAVLLEDDLTFGRFGCSSLINRKRAVRSKVGCISGQEQKFFKCCRTSQRFAMEFLPKLSLCLVF